MPRSGIDAGWYPVELFRYSLIRGTGRDDEADLEPVNNRWDGRRVMASAHLGFRF